MAHVGRAYPYAARRDLSLCNQIMTWLPRRRVVLGNLIQTNASWSNLTGRFVSDDYVLDEDTGTYEYTWPEFTREGITWKWYLKYELTHAATQTRLTWGWWVNGNYQQQSGAFVQPRLDTIVGGNLTQNLGGGISVTWYQCFTGPATWAESS